MNNLLIIGTSLEAAGIGGVTIHVHRLLQYLDKHHMPYTFFDYKKNGKWELIKALHRNKLVHIHLCNTLALLLFVVAAKMLFCKVLFTYHGNYGRYGYVKNALVWLSFKLADIPIAINRVSFEACKQINRCTEFIPAFIPPQDNSTLDETTAQKIAYLKTQGYNIFSTNAFNIAYDKEGRDIYGIKFLIDFFVSRKGDALLVSDPSGNYHKMLGDFADNIVFVDYPHNYYELLKRVDYFIRNTSTDGDALSVKEALHVGCRVLCSDVVDRPCGCTLFHYCDTQSLAKGIIQATNTPQSHTQINGAEQLMQLYERVNKS